MANTYITTTAEITTTGSNVTFFTAPSGGCIVRNVMIYAKSAATVTVNYDDRSTDVAIHKATLATNELWEPFSTPLGMPSSNFLKLNTSAAVNVLVTYVQFS